MSQPRSARPGTPVAQRLVACALGLVMAACGSAEQPQRQAVAADDGVQATGRLGGQRVAISDGEPAVTSGDCDPADGADDDLCLTARTIDGLEVTVVIENPAVLVDGETVPVRADGCAGAACDGVDEVAVVDVLTSGDRTRASGGRLAVRGTGTRVAADFTLSLPGGDQLIGSFNVAPAGG